MLSRRTLIANTAGVAVSSATPAWAQPPKAEGDANSLHRLFDAFFLEGLRSRPESATQLGLDTGANSDLKGRLTNDSEAGTVARKALTRDQLSRLKAIDRTQLSQADRLNYDVVLYTRQSASAVQQFDFGGASYGPSPYVVSQLTGAYQAVPDFLDTKHTIETGDDADAYLSRLNGFADQLEANTAQMRHDAGRGIVPPDFLLDTTLVQLQKTRVPVAEALVVTSLARRAAAKGLPQSYGRSAAQIYTGRVLPALDRQIAETRRLRMRATHGAGLWKFKDGPAFYRVALNTTTTTRFSPDEVHRIGLDQAREIGARLNALLAAQGLTQGSVGSRMAHLYKDPSQLYPDTDAGRAQAIAYCNARLAQIRPRLPSVFKRLPNYSFEVRRVPVQTEAGAPSAFSQAPALDGSRPGLVYFNLRDTAEWPKFCLATTVFHEGLPGHQLEGGLALSNADLPLIRKSASFSGYAEGWALYAEQLADEIGMYDDDPLGRLGYLKFQLFRANRCVVDTGIHHLRWSREQAIAYFVDQDGEAPGFATREVERYCSIPGQACSYKLGHSVFSGLREKAKAELGPTFDIRDFHEAVLNCGRTPLDILQQVGSDWIAQGRLVV